MQNRIDSSIVEYNEDGSQTITTVEHYVPPTRTQQIAGLATLGLITLSPVLFIGAVAAYESMVEKREARKEAQKLKSV